MGIEVQEKAHQEAIIHYQLFPRDVRGVRQTARRPFSVVVLVVHLWQRWMLLLLLLLVLQLVEVMRVLRASPGWKQAGRFLRRRRHRRVVAAAAEDVRDAFHNAALVRVVLAAAEAIDAFC